MIPKMAHCNQLGNALVQSVSAPNVFGSFDAYNIGTMLVVILIYYDVCASAFLDQKLNGR